MVSLLFVVVLFHSVGFAVLFFHPLPSLWHSAYNPAQYNPDGSAMEDIGFLSAIIVKARERGTDYPLSTNSSNLRRTLVLDSWADNGDILRRSISSNRADTHRF